MASLSAVSVARLALLTLLDASSRVHLPNASRYPRHFLAPMSLSTALYNGPLVSDSFRGSDLPDCNRCQEIAVEREDTGKRRLGIGRLRPNVVLYGEENRNDDLIRTIAKRDLQRGSDIVFVVGTGLKVPGARRLVTELCRAATALD